jgi:hypothetical protein
VCQVTKLICNYLITLGSTVSPSVRYDIAFLFIHFDWRISYANLMFLFFFISYVSCLLSLDNVYVRLCSFFTDCLNVDSASLLLLLSSSSSSSSSSLCIKFCYILISFLSIILIYFNFVFFFVLYLIVYIVLFEYTIIQNILRKTAPNFDRQQWFVASTFYGFLNVWFLPVPILKGKVYE